MKYTPQQTIPINEASHKTANKFYELLFNLVITNADLANRFNKLMSKVKLPYIDKSGTLHCQHLTEIYLTRTLEEKVEKVSAILERLEKVSSIPLKD
jgi:hypothetical protein